MAYFRISDAQAAYQRSNPGSAFTASAARDVLRTKAVGRRTDRFDIFLSHSSGDAQIIAGIHALLERDGSRVYVDWMYDPQLDRSRVTASTARVLRDRMKASASLIYVSSSSSPESKWMPWELGYFDGLRPNKVAILPVVRSSDNEFKGIEFVGLYPKIERGAVGDPRVTLGSRTQSLNQFRG